MLGQLRAWDQRVMDAMGRAERDARLGQVEAVRNSFSKAGSDAAQARGLGYRAGLEAESPREMDEMVMATMQAGGPEADHLMAQAVGNTPQGLIGKGAHLLAQDNTVGGLARGAVFGGGVTAGGAAMTAGAQKLVALMDLMGESDEVEVARDQPLTS
jgi:hypothetical protein